MSIKRPVLAGRDVQMPWGQPRNSPRQRGLQHIYGHCRTVQDGWMGGVDGFMVHEDSEHEQQCFRIIICPYCRATKASTLHHAAPLG